jgi:hypothetical protein
VPLSRWSFGEGQCSGIEVLENIDDGLSVVGEGGMSGMNEQRKLGTTGGSPRRSRTAKASRISRHNLDPEPTCRLWCDAKQLVSEGW